MKLEAGLRVRFLPLANFTPVLDDESLILFLRYLYLDGSLSRAAIAMHISKSTAHHRARKLQRLGFLGKDFRPLANLYLPFTWRDGVVQLHRRPLLLLMDGEVYVMRQECVGPHTCVDCSFRNTAGHVAVRYARSLGLAARGVYPSELVDAVVDRVMERVSRGFTLLVL